MLCLIKVRGAFPCDVCGERSEVVAGGSSASLALLFILWIIDFFLFSLFACPRICHSFCAHYGTLNTGIFIWCFGTWWCLVCLGISCCSFLLCLPIYEPVQQPCLSFHFWSYGFLLMGNCRPASLRVNPRTVSCCFMMLMLMLMLQPFRSGGLTARLSVKAQCHSWVMNHDTELSSHSSSTLPHELAHLRKRNSRQKVPGRLQCSCSGCTGCQAYSSLCKNMT